MAVGGGNSPLGDFTMSKAPVLWDRAMGIANTPFKPYPGQLTPNVPGVIGQAQAAAQNVANFQPQQITAPNMHAASSGVYGLLPQQPQGLTMGAPAPQMMPMTGAPSPMPAPMPAPMAQPNRGDFSDRRQFRDARHAYRDQQHGGGMTPTGGPGGPGGGAHDQPSVAAMQGLQGLDAYTNPFQQQVTDRTLSGLDQFRQMALNQNASGAAMSGAFSNDRLGVENALTNEGFARQAGDMLANLNMHGFNTGAGLLMGDKSNLLQNQQFNAGLQQQTNMANQQSKLAAGVANQGAANDAARVNAAGAQTLGQLGQLQFGMEGAGTDAAYQEFLRQLQLPYQQQGALIGALGGVAPGGAAGYTSASHPFAMSFGESLGQGLGGGMAGGANSYLWGK